MKKPTHFTLKMCFLGLFGVLLFVWYYFRLPYVLRSLTGIPCPTCGLTRAWLYALHLDFSGAFRQYPMFWAVPLLVLYLLYDGQLFPNPKFSYLCVGAFGRDHPDLVCTFIGFFRWSFSTLKVKIL